MSTITWVFTLILLIKCGHLHSFRHAIIAGAQKSGTTAFAALLSTCSNITLAKSKELHFFDRSMNFELGINKYHSYFKDSPGTHSSGVLLEATPFYLASRVACQRISTTLVDAKLIILLREPVSRAYSEYQMKLRRVDEHKELMHMLEEQSTLIAGCALSNPQNYSEMTRCLPSHITELPRWSKFLGALKKAQAVIGNWTSTVQQCFPSALQPVEGTGVCEANLDSCESAAPDYPRSKENMDLYTLRDSKDHSAAVSPVVEHPTVQHSFSGASCFKYYPEGMERAKSLRQAVMGEIESFRNCSAPFMVNMTQLQLDSEGETSYGLFLCAYPCWYHAKIIITWFASEVSAADAEAVLEVLNHAVDACIPVRSGISAQYIYRSMYAVQLHHCYKVRRHSRTSYELLPNHTFTFTLTCDA